MIPIHNKLRKISTISGEWIRRPSEVKRSLSRIYSDVVMANSPIPSISSFDFLGENISINLENFLSVDGNVTLDELVFISALSRKIKPRIVLEIGTFDGNTTLQLGLNTPAETKIFTLDLPVGAKGDAENDPEDTKYITSPRRVRRKFIGSGVEHKIIQCYGNTLTYDLRTLPLMVSLNLFSSMQDTATNAFVMIVKKP